MKEFGVQLYSVRDTMNDEAGIRETFRRLREMGYTQVQTAGCEIPFADFGRIAAEEGLQIVGTHEVFDPMYENFDAVLADHQALNTKFMGVGLYTRSQEPEVWYDFCKKANEVGRKCAQHGMKFTYHNHSFEFVKMANGESAFDILIKELDPETTSFCLDTYWIQHGGGDVCAWIEKLKGRIDILHLKDMQRLPHFKDKVGYQFYTEIGQGNMDWERIIDTADRCGVKYYIVEQDTCPGDPMDSMKISADYLKTLIK